MSNTHLNQEISQSVIITNMPQQLTHRTTVSVLLRPLPLILPTKSQQSFRLVLQRQCILPARHPLLLPHLQYVPLVSTSINRACLSSGRMHPGFAISITKSLHHLYDIAFLEVINRLTLYITADLSPTSLSIIAPIHKYLMLQEVISFNSRLISCSFPLTISCPSNATNVTASQAYLRTLPISWHTDVRSHPWHTLCSLLAYLSSDHSISFSLEIRMQIPHPLSRYTITSPLHQDTVPPKAKFSSPISAILGLLVLTRLTSTTV